MARVTQSIGPNLVLSGFLNESKGTNIASASTTNIGAATGNYVNITGTTTITAFDTVQAGTRRILTFNGALTLTYNATSLILPGAASITTVAGDSATFVSLGGGNWICVNYLSNSTGAWLTDWTPTFTGFSAIPTAITSRYRIIDGKTCHFYMRCTAGTSNATTFTMTLPAVAANTIVQVIWTLATDNGNPLQPPGRLATRVNSNIADCYPSFTTTAWTNTGGKGIFVEGFFEMA